ncbi:2-oxoglutarate dehydrogenase E1 subunit family protein, partial [Mycobacterium kansasii]
MANISSPFGQNEWLVEEMYRKFRDDPSSVDPSWHEFLVDYNPEPAQSAPADNQQVATAPPPEPVRPAAEPVRPATKPAGA